MSFLIDEVKDRDKSDYTPLDLFQFTDIEHIMHADFPTIEELVEQGLVEETTYEEAYRSVGLYDQYSQSMGVLGISEETVYQITPKGNTLIDLSNDGGRKIKKSKRVKKLVPSHNGT